MMRLLLIYFFDGSPYCSLHSNANASRSNRILMDLFDKAVRVASNAES